jgi:hypothetical protein
LIRFLQNSEVKFSALDSSEKHIHERRLNITDLKEKSGNRWLNAHKKETLA